MYSSSNNVYCIWTLILAWWHFYIIIFFTIQTGSKILSPFSAKALLGCLPMVLANDTTSEKLKKLSLAFQIFWQISAVAHTGCAQFQPNFKL